MMPVASDLHEFAILRGAHAPSRDENLIFTESTRTRKCWSDWGDPERHRSDGACSDCKSSLEDAFQAGVSHLSPASKAYLLRSFETGLPGRLKDDSKNLTRSGGCSSEVRNIQRPVRPERHAGGNNKAGHDILDFSGPFNPNHFPQAGSWIPRTIG